MLVFVLYFFDFADEEFFGVVEISLLTFLALLMVFDEPFVL